MAIEGGERGVSAGRRLYWAWCGSAVSDRARYFDLMNPAGKEAWERVGAAVAEAERLLGAALVGHERGADAPHVFSRGEVADLEMAREALRRVVA